MKNIEYKTPLIKKKSDIAYARLIRKCAALQSSRNTPAAEEQVCQLVELNIPGMTSICYFTSDLCLQVVGPVKGQNIGFIHQNTKLTSFCPKEDLLSLAHTPNCYKIPMVITPTML